MERFSQLYKKYINLKHLVLDCVKLTMVAVGSKLKMTQRTLPVWKEHQTDANVQQASRVMVLNHVKMLMNVKKELLVNVLNANARILGETMSAAAVVIYYTWMGRYEAHLWDNSCKKDKQGREGKGLVPLAGSNDESWCQGLDGLASRCTTYYQQGDRLAKWCIVVSIPNDPSALAVKEAAWGLARYAAMAQNNGLVLLMYPQIFLDGELLSPKVDLASGIVLIVTKKVGRVINYLS